MCAFVVVAVVVLSFVFVFVFVSPKGLSYVLYFKY